MKVATCFFQQACRQAFMACIVCFLLVFFHSSSYTSSKPVNYFVKTLEGNNLFNFDTVETKYAYMVSPSGICLGLNGEVFVSDIARHLVFRIFGGLSKVEVYAGYVTSGFNGDGLPAVGTLLNTPTSISVNPLNGDLYIADTLNDKIRIVSNSTKLVSSMRSVFNRPRGVHVSSNGFVYIADTENHLIKKYEISTQLIYIIGGGGYLSGDYDGVDAKLLKLQFPKNLYVVSNGAKDIVYFTDEERIKSIDENGFYRMIDGGVPQTNLFGIYVSKQGEIYATSQTNHFIQMKNAKSSQQELYIGSALFESGYSGDNESLYSSNIKFYEPSSLVVADNSILVADKSNNCIRKIDLQSKMVSSLAGGFINHPYGENISPLNIYNPGSVTFPFNYKNEFYFVEKNVVLRKVSNGKMTTVLGCEQPLAYPSNIPQRTYFAMASLQYLANGDVILQSSSDYSFYNFNLDTQKLTLIQNIDASMIPFYAIGNSIENATIYFRVSQSIVVFNSNSKSLNGLVYESGNVSREFGVISDLRFNGTNSIFSYDRSSNVLNEYVDYKNGSVVWSERQLPTTVVFSGVTVSERHLYMWNGAQLFEIELETFSLTKIGGFDPFNVSGVLNYITGFNGENIPINTSVLYIPKPVRSGSKIYVTNQNSVSEISNGRIFTVAGSTPISKIIFPIMLMRDSIKKIIYFVDGRTIKKYDENTGVTTSLTTSMYPSLTFPVDTPYFMIGLYPQSKTFGFFSSFDRMIYIKDSCRIIRIDPETMNFEIIIGNSCTSSLEPGIRGRDSAFPPTMAQSGMTYDPSNGDLIISLENFQIYRYNLQTRLLSLEIIFTPSLAFSPDGIITNETLTGPITNIIYQNGYLYFSTRLSIRRIEKLSENTFYLRTIIGNSQQGYSGDNLPALKSSLDNPLSFNVKKNGDIIILDGLGTYFVRMYQNSTGLLLDIAGSRTTPKFNGDGFVPYPTFSYFSKQVEYDESSGEVFLIDARNFLRKIIPTCSGNYTFNSLNNTCDSVFTCNGTLAASGLVCNGNGVCSDFDVCLCKDGFEGKYCETRKSQVSDLTILIISIVIPMVGSILILLTILIVIIVLVVCCSRKKKKKENFELSQVESNTIELSDNSFPSSSSAIISSSIGSSIGSESENPFSRYSNITRIGKGAFGSVFKVNDTKNRNKLKAIKLVRFETLTDLNTVMKEASQLSCVQHPNIIKMNDYFITNDNLLIIDMDYYEMGDLTQLKSEYCTESFIKQILKQMLSALVYVHEEMHIIHRDIKPTNIFIKNLTSESIEVVLADFGLAKKYQEDKGQSYAGTPLYMSPEVALGSTYSFNTDIFSLGVSIYQTMTNDRATSIGNLLMGNQSGNAINILTNQMKESTSHEYSDELIDIVLKMVEKDSKQRLNAIQLLSLPYFQ